MTDSTQVRALVAEALKGGARTVEDVHKAIGTMPADALRRLGLERPADDAERVNKAVGAGIRSINDQITRVAHDFLSQTPGSDTDQRPI